MKNTVQCEARVQSRNRRFDFGIATGPALIVVRPRVLLALSESERPMESLRRAAALAGKLGGELHVVRVLPEASRIYGGESRRKLNDILRAIEWTLTSQRRTRSWIREELNGSAAVGGFSILHGGFVDSVAAYAAEVDAQLILVAPPREQGAADVSMLASVTGVSVLVAQGAGANHTIVAATDLQDPKFPVLRAAADMGQLLGQSVVALHSIQPASTRQGEPSGEPHALPAEELALGAQFQQLARVSERLLSAAPAVVRREADPVDAILAEARARDADLIVVGAPRGSWFARFCATDVATRLVRRARRSVLVAPSNRAREVTVPG